MTSLVKPGIDLLKTLAAQGGYWKWEPGQRYLAELTSGKISDVFCNTGVLTTNPELLRDVIRLILRKLSEQRAYLWQTEGPLIVIGPAFGGITLAYELVRHLGYGKAFFTEPVYDIGGAPPPLVKIRKSGQKFRFGDRIPKGSTILFIEDVITTGKTSLEMMAAMKEVVPHGEFEIFSYLPCLVNRSGKKSLIRPVCPGAEQQMKILAIAEVTARTWDTLEEAQADCEGVVDAVRPKANWQQLVEG